MAGRKLSFSRTRTGNGIKQATHYQDENGKSCINEKFVAAHLAIHFVDPRKQTPGLLCSGSG